MSSAAATAVVSLFFMRHSSAPLSPPGRQEIGALKPKAYELRSSLLGTDLCCTHH